MSPKLILAQEIERTNSCSESDHIFMSDSEAFSMTEANYCVLLLDHLLHGKQIHRTSACELKRNEISLFESKKKFNEEKSRNGLDYIFNILKFCITEANVGNDISHFSSN